MQNDECGGTQKSEGSGPLAGDAFFTTDGPVSVPGDPDGFTTFWEDKDRARRRASSRPRSWSLPTWSRHAPDAAATGPTSPGVDEPPSASAEPPPGADDRPSRPAPAAKETREAKDRPGRSAAAARRSPGRSPAATPAGPRTPLPVRPPSRTERPRRPAARTAQVPEIVIDGATMPSAVAAGKGPAGARRMASPSSWRSLLALDQPGLRLVRQGSLAVLALAVTGLLIASLTPDGVELETTSATTTATTAVGGAETPIPDALAAQLELRTRTSDDALSQAALDASTSTTDVPASATTRSGATSTTAGATRPTPATVGATATTADVASSARGTSSTTRATSSTARATSSTARATSSTARVTGSSAAVPSSGTNPSTSPTTRASTSSSTQPATAASAAATASSAAAAASTEAPTTPSPTTPSTPAPTTPSTPAPTTPSTPTPISDSGCWNLVLQDDFNGSSLNTAAWSPFNSSGNAGHGLRRPSAITVANGLLTITARMENGTLVSGGMSHRHSQTYGRYEVRVRTDRDPSEATSGVVMTWPQSNQHPRDGENNFYETLATPGDRHEFYSFIHKPFGTIHDQDYTVHSASAADWHTMALEWRPNQIKIYRDGAVIRTLDETPADLIPDVPHFNTIQLDAWKDAMGDPVSMQIDYIRIYSAC